MPSMDLDDHGILAGSGLLRSKVFSQIENDILTGKYKPGESLTEMRLSEDMKVSRTPIREALRQLELEGLVQSIPNKGVVVTGIVWQDIEDIYTIRIRIEGLAAKLAAEKINPAELKDLEDTLDLTEYYANKNNLGQLLRLDGEFHAIIFQASKNRPLMYMMKNFHNYVKRARSESLNMPGRSQKIVAEHRDILEAIKSGNGVLAEKAYIRHIKHTLSTLQKAMMAGEEPL